jgi:ribosomal protein S18 acetylase RimI-like enzyme
VSGGGFSTYPLGLDEATRFLARDPAGNVELLTALRYDADVRCIAAYRSDSVTSVDPPNAVRRTDSGDSGFPKLPIRVLRGRTGTDHGNVPLDALPVGLLVAGREGAEGRLTARVATEDAAALDALITAFPRGVSRVVVHRAWMLPALIEALPLIPDDVPETLFSLATTPVLPTPGVRPLTMADAPVMAASATLWGRLGLVDALRAGFRPFGIVQGARVVACAMAANVTEWTEEVMSVWTAPRHRGRGFATAVVAATAADIIARGKIATYVAAVTNHASQRVAAKVGFRRAYDIAPYRIARSRTERH